jgi:CRP-like cAMP-binding protein
MISKMLERSKLRPECSNNYLAPQLDNLIRLFKEFEGDGEGPSLFERIALKKGEYLLKEGMVTSNTWFLEEGAARLFFNKDGVELTGDFFFPYEFVDSYGCSALQIPSKVNIQLIRDSIVYLIDWANVRDLQHKYLILSEIEKVIAACNVLWLEERVFSLQSLSAEERYKQLLDRQPHFVQHIPLTYIASFLGISLETLSRIRAKQKI